MSGPIGEAELCGISGQFKGMMIMRPSFRLNYHDVLLRFFLNPEM